MSIWSLFFPATSLLLSKLLDLTQSLIIEVLGNVLLLLAHQHGSRLLPIWQGKPPEDMVTFIPKPF